MEGQKRVVVVVEESEAANAALGWAVGNFIRPGDVVTLLHVHPPSRSRRKKKALRLRGFQLALSFKDRCAAVPEVKVEIVVKDGDPVAVISSLVDEIRASALVIGLHEHSCLYRMTPRNLGSKELKDLGRCRILAVKPRHEIESKNTRCIGFETVEFTQVEITRICSLFSFQHKTTQNPIPDLPIMCMEEEKDKAKGKKARLREMDSQI